MGITYLQSFLPKQSSGVIKGLAIYDFITR